MASIRFGGGVVDARGSIAGNTFSRNASGGYQRARTAPTNPQTARQQIVRQLLSDSAQLWRTLTDGERQEWIDLATTQAGQYVNRLGEVSNYSGQQLFMKVQQLRNAWTAGGGSIAGNGGIDPPPLTPAPGSVTLGAATFEVTALNVISTVTIDVEAAAATNAVMVYASPPVSAGIMRPASVRFVLLASLANVTVAGLDVAAAYEAAFGPEVPPGYAVWFKVMRLSTTSWRTAPPEHIKALVAAEA